MDDLRFAALRDRPGTSPAYSAIGVPCAAHKPLTEFGAPRPV
jgi:hypothetical protein